MTSFETLRRLRTPVWVLALVASGFLYGFLTAQLPAPRTDAARFWLGNLAAPYLLLGFVAGAGRRTAWASALSGAAVTVAAVAGFYNVLAVGSVTASQFGLPLDTPRGAVVRRAYGFWLRNLVLGDPGGLPWLSIAFVVGLVCGWLGWRWYDGNRLAATPVALAFVVEPVGHATGVIAAVSGSRQGFYAFNIVVWVVEAALGLMAFALVYRRSPARSAHDGGDRHARGAHARSERAGHRGP